MYKSIIMLSITLLAISLIGCNKQSQKTAQANKTCAAAKPQLVMVISEDKHKH